MGKGGVRLSEFVGRHTVHVGQTAQTRYPPTPGSPLDDLRKLVVPDFASDDEAVARLAAAYDAYAEDVLLPLPQMDECATRKALDKAVCAALGIDSETVATIRRQLAAEPSVTGKRYAG